MKPLAVLEKYNAHKLIAVSFGILGGIGSAVHGIGEIKQGNIRPDSIFIPSWTKGPIALYYDGDPGITLIPNMLATGITSFILSLLVILWAGTYLGTKRNGAILVLLSLALLFTGGGVGPPVVTFLAGIAALRISHANGRARPASQGGIGRLLSSLWPYIFAITLANGIFLVIGHLVAAYFFAPVNGDIFTGSFLLAIILLVLSIIAANYFEAAAP